MTELIRRIVLASVLTVLATPALPDDAESAFLFFASLDDLERSSVDEPTIQTSDFTPTIDLLWTARRGDWRFLGEYYLTDDEAELERLQVGYDYRPDSTFWFGRFHQPVSVWNFRYHHGAYLQPSISKPAIENWEDEGGVIPAHVTGFMLSSSRSMKGNSRLDYVVSLGVAPVVDDDELLPFDILSPDDSAGKIALGFSINYSPDLVSETGIGIVGGYSEIESTMSPAAGTVAPFLVKQSLIGAQFNWENHDWEFLSAAYYVDHDVPENRRDAGGWLFSAYAQLIRQTSKNTNAYVRLEHTENARTAGYLRLFPHFLVNRTLAGFRFDFARRQAVAIELSRNEVILDDYSEIRVQWSAAFP